MATVTTLAIAKTYTCNIQRFFFEDKNENFIGIFFFLAQNIHCGYTLESPQRDGSNVYLQCMFWIKNKEVKYTPAYPSFSI